MPAAASNGKYGAATNGTTARTLTKTASAGSPLLLEGELADLVGRVEARLERRRQHEDERQGDAAVAAREQALGGGDQALALPRKLHAFIVVARRAPRVARHRDLRSHPRG